MDAIKCSSSFLHTTKLNTLFSNNSLPKISTPNFKRIFRPISISAKYRRSSEAENVPVVEKPLKSEKFFVSDGLPSPFGATVRADGGVNFSVYSANSDLRQNKVTEEIQLDPSRNRTGHVWHVVLKGNFKDMLYGYRFDGKFSPEDGHYYDSSNILLDLYAKAIISRDEFGVLGPDENCWPHGVYGAHS